MYVIKQNEYYEYFFELVYLLSEENKRKKIFS
jgi:hypothetical protein